MAVSRKKKQFSILPILAFLLLIFWILNFDVVVNKIDPTGKMGLAGIAKDGFMITMGITLIVIGVAAIASPWVAIALVAVGVGLVATKLYSIYKRKMPSGGSTPG